MGSTQRKLAKKLTVSPKVSPQNHIQVLWMRRFEGLSVGLAEPEVVPFLIESRKHRSSMTGPESNKSLTPTTVPYVLQLEMGGWWRERRLDLLGSYPHLQNRSNQSKSWPCMAYKRGSGHWRCSLSRILKIFNQGILSPWPRNRFTLSHKQLLQSHGMSVQFIYIMRGSARKDRALQ